MAVASGWPLDPLLIGVFTLRSHRWGTKRNIRQRYLLGTILPCMTIFFQLKNLGGEGGWRVWGRLYHNTALIPRGFGGCKAPPYTIVA